MSQKIKVLVVDDSFLMRRIISDIVNSDPALEVVGKAQDGQEALQKLVELKPDVITLDINLPNTNGIDVLCEILKTRPTPVIMLSAYSRAGASATMRALELGAVDFIAKPLGEISLGLEQLKDEIIAKIKLAASIELEKYLASLRSIEGVTAAAPVVTIPEIKKIVVIGSSTGGPKAIINFLRDIPVGLPATFLIVQHMPKGFTASFAERISWKTGIRTKEAEDNDIIEPDRAYVAPAGYHMILKQHNDKIVISLNHDPPVNFVRPSVDVTLLSCVEIFGKDTIAVILTGMGKDGLEGVRKVKELGGKVFVQDEDSSVVWGMPGSVAKAGLANAVADLPRLAKLVVKQINAS